MPSRLHFRGTGLLAAASALVCLASLAGLAGQFWWVFDLATHFRVQYVLVLTFGALAALIQRHYRWTAVFIGFALFNLSLLTPQLLPQTQDVASTGNPVFSVLLANVNSAHRDPATIRRAIADQDPDFILLLEITPWMLEHLDDLADNYPYLIAEPRKDNFGIALFSRHPFAKTGIFSIGPIGRPSILAEFTAGGNPFTLLGAHPPPPVSAELTRERNDQLNGLAQHARQTRQPLLLIGDLNLSPWSPWFHQLLADSGLQDSATGHGIQPTWPVGWPLLWIPIDHALFSKGIQIRRRSVGANLGSDHYPVLVEFQVTSR